MSIDVTGALPKTAGVARGRGDVDRTGGTPEAAGRPWSVEGSCAATARPGSGLLGAFGASASPSPSESFRAARPPVTARVSRGWASVRTRRRPAPAVSRRPEGSRPPGRAGPPSDARQVVTRHPSAVLTIAAHLPARAHCPAENAGGPGSRQAPQAQHTRARPTETAATPRLTVQRSPPPA